MSGAVISLDDHRPHETFYAACVACAHDWVAVVPAGVDSGLECSNCHKMTGEKVRVDDVDWFKRWWAAAGDKADQSRRTVICLHANRMKGNW